MMITTERIPYSNNSTTLFAPLESLPWAVFLDSCQPQSQQGRFDIFTACPYLTLTTTNAHTVIASENSTQTTTDDPFELVKHYLQPQAELHELPFCGGAIGFFSYDLARRLEKLPTHAAADLILPEMMIGFYDWAIVVDHAKQQSWLVNAGRHHATQTMLQQIKQKWLSTAPPSQAFKITAPFTPNINEAEYTAAFNKIQDYIVAGDCYQINFSQRFAAPFTGSAWSAYLALREKNSVPFAAYLNYPQSIVLSLSPERFLKVHAGHVETKPIKGTRPRGSTAIEDQQLRQELANSAKDKAENVMIVDLLRNDLSKACKPHSVQVPHLFTIESFPAVHHLVSTITGELTENNQAIDLLRACFPGGSVTGAPKIRAMEIIDELEKYRRNIYCGSVGYLSFDGKMDTNITIRTLLAYNNYLYCSAGGAIVADSDCATEYAETFHKITKLLNILQTYAN